MEHSLLGLCFFDFYFVNGKKPSSAGFFLYLIRNLIDFAQAVVDPAFGNGVG